MLGAHTLTRAELDAIAGRLEAAQADAVNLRAKRVRRLANCCAPLACVGVGEAHYHDLCPRCLADARALNFNKGSA